jgi:molybdopterin/thiamine biosynthesis adenylyltransferase
LNENNELQSRYGRIKGIVDVASLSRKRVTLIGLGSMGQPISGQLVRHGIATRLPGRIRLIDGDIVSARNLIGTEYRLKHLNRPKAVAAYEIIKEIDKDVTVSYWNRSLKDSDIPHVVEMANMSDLLGLFADSFDLMLKISDRCYDTWPAGHGSIWPQC